jgi:ferritin-like metal-binding protein YciE
MKNQENSALYELFLEELKDIHGAEKQLTKALPKMAEAATSEKLRTAFEDHLDITQMQIERIEKVFELMGEKVDSKKCEAMAGLVKEGEEIIEDTEKGTMVRDCGLIIAAQKVEHYEIGTYGSLRTLARLMGENEVAELLQATLDEEKDTDENLTRIAEGSINEKAYHEG